MFTYPVPGNPGHRAPFWDIYAMGYPFNDRKRSRSRTHSKDRASSQESHESLDNPEYDDPHADDDPMAPAHLYNLIFWYVSSFLHPLGNFFTDVEARINVIIGSFEQPVLAYIGITANPIQRFRSHCAKRLPTRIKS
jgi:hypothetical protein